VLKGSSKRELGGYIASTETIFRRITEKNKIREVHYFQVLYIAKRHSFEYEQARLQSNKTSSTESDGAIDAQVIDMTKGYMSTYKQMCGVLRAEGM
jgi:hypothetical protein